MRIGLLGGSFDPVHKAHIELAKTALRDLELDQVQLLPARQPWQKPILSASCEDRLAMVEMAISDTAGLSVNPVELNRPGKTYTIDTLTALPADHDYFWILGSDQLQNFPTWHRWQDIASLVTLVVAHRPGAVLLLPDELQKQVDDGQAHVQVLNFRPMDISASHLRHAIKAGESTEHWLDPRVAAYIADNHLYQSEDKP